jgi:hypothetical protein
MKQTTTVAGNQALIAKIGENGEPFNPFKRIITGEGALEDETLESHNGDRAK